MDADFIGKRITELRLQKKISERKLSIELDKGENYIQGITSGNSSISIEMIYKICDYFEIPVWKFFCESEKQALVQTAAELMNDLNEEDIIMIIGFIKRLKTSD